MVSIRIALLAAVIFLGIEEAGRTGFQRFPDIVKAGFFTDQGRGKDRFIFPVISDDGQGIFLNVHAAVISIGKPEGGFIADRVGKQDIPVFGDRG